MTNGVPARPQPRPTSDSQPHWDGLAAGQYLIQGCARCGALRHYPRPVCPACHSTEVRWTPASGRGRLHSWTVAHHAFHPAFAADVPYILALADLEEGVRINAPLRKADAALLRLGLPVRIAFETTAQGQVLPCLELE